MQENSATPTTVELELPSRRLTERCPCHHITFYRPLADRDTESALATICNVSATGIALLVRSCIKSGTILALELQGTVNGITHLRLARVSHATDQRDGYWMIGCEFASRLEEKELEALAR